LVTYLEVGAGGIVPSSYNYRCWFLLIFCCRKQLKQMVQTIKV
jgi:hypothetical protein